jgi:hypothetical protein
MSDVEKEKLTVEKIELMKRIESLEDGITNIKTETIESTKEKAIQKFTNGDTELADKVKEKLNRFQPPKTKEEMLQNVREAYMLAAGKEPSVVFNPGLAGTPSGGSSYQNQESATKADPVRVEALGRSMGLGNYFDEQK